MNECIIKSKYANLDASRPLRNGFCEVIYGENKTYEQMKDIIKALIDAGKNIFATRVSEEIASKLVKNFEKLLYHKISRTLKLVQKEIELKKGSVAICTGGTADIQVAEEAYQTLEMFGIESERFYDVGVAGLHRILSKIDAIKDKNVIIVIAGMEGALPSVVGGLFKQPIIAVPTSIGYGANLDGLTTLHAMLTSCAEGISVVNIDNGFGAACSAIRILNLSSDKNEH